MKLSHNMKLEDVDMLVEKLVCPVCPYTTRNMEEYKNHMVAVHKKDKWNWSLELKAICFCDECDVEFPDKTMLRKHIQGGHRELSLKIIEYSIKNQRDPNLRELPTIIKKQGRKGVFATNVLHEFAHKDIITVHPVRRPFT